MPRQPLLRLLVLAAAAALAACGGSAPEAAPATQKPADALSARELLDATEAIEKLLAAERSHEAVLIARKLLEKAPAGSSAAPAANAIAARAFFTHARLPTSTLASDERKALLSEAAACAVASIAADERDDAKIAFAALLASGGGRSADARRLFDQALSIAANDAGLLLQATLAAVQDGDLDRARTLAKRRRDAKPRDAWNDALDAEICLAAGETHAAVGAAQRAATLDRDALEFRLLLGRTLRKDGRARDAARMLAALEPAARTKPALTEQLALALAEAGDLAGAARAWSDCVAANPGDPYARAEAVLAFRAAGDEPRAASELANLHKMPSGAAEYRRIAPKLAEPGR